MLVKNAGMINRKWNSNPASWHLRNLRRRICRLLSMIRKL